VDFLVNVACSYLDNGAESTRAEWLESLDVNIVGSVMLMQAAQEELARNKGAIVNFGSISARVAQTGRWLYPVSKAAILQLTRNQAMDLAGDGIRVNAVSPGWTWSNIMDELSGGNREKTDGVAAPFHLLRRTAIPRRWRIGRNVPVLGRGEFHHRNRYPGRWRLHRDGPGAGGAGHSALDGLNKTFFWREKRMRKITIMGEASRACSWGLGLLKNGYQVRVVQNRTGEEIATGRVLSSQCMFTTVQNERDLGIDFWSERCPPVEGIQFSVPDPEGSGNKVIDWASRLDKPGFSVDQRVKMPKWLDEFESLAVISSSRKRNCRSGGLCAPGRSGSGCIRQGRGGPAVRTRCEKSAYDKPMRALALTYVTGMTPRAEHSAVCFNLIPGVGEYFVFPALTTTGPCEIMVFEGVPGGPMDCWGDVETPEAHLAKSKEILDTFLPWESNAAAT
jgi:hypothetical protein